MKVLTLNCGSSSVKYSVWEMPGAIPLCQGIVERVGIGGSFIRQKVSGSDEIRIEQDCPTGEAAIRLIFSAITDKENGVISDFSEINAVAHRVVHGGESYTHSVMVDDDVIQAIKDNAVLAPLHNPNNLIGIQIAMETMPDIPHTASWDTSYSAGFMPKHTSIYAIPYEYYEKYGIRRYGYQGLSHTYVVKRAAVLMGKKRTDVNVVSLHIGNGSTVTATKKGLPYDQSLGFSTAGEGLVMGTRSGDLDPGVLLFLMQHANMSAAEVETMMYKESGVLGLSGKYVDRRDIIEAAAKGDERCQLALDVECLRLKKYIGGYAAILEGVDAIVFTAGVGESSAIHRERACEGLEYMGIHLDKEKNKTAVGRVGETEISTPDSPVKVFVIPTDEELVMVEDAIGILEDRFDPVNFDYSFEALDYVPSYLRFE
jgi:acetate kinase